MFATIAYEIWLQRNSLISNGGNAAVGPNRILSNVYFSLTPRDEPHLYSPPPMIIRNINQLD
ncbi:hypothetical protein ABFV55_27560, partial [Pseudomonas syringae]|uniref:hypothetical protein n=1 Tax=Pseudomonas syringae TaxID=317 RepID=UPI0034D96E22